MDRREISVINTPQNLSRVSQRSRTQDKGSSVVAFAASVSRETTGASVDTDVLFIKEIDEAL